MGRPQKSPELTWTQYTELLALDTARLRMPGTAVHVSTGIGAGPAASA